MKYLIALIWFLACLLIGLVGVCLQFEWAKAYLWGMTPMILWVNYLGGSGIISWNRVPKLANNLVTRSGHYLNGFPKAVARVDELAEEFSKETPPLQDPEVGSGCPACGHYCNCK